MPHSHLNSTSPLFPTICVLLALPLFIAAFTSCGKQTDGETVFLTGKRANGQPVPMNLDRSALKNPTMEIGCTACHGLDARGMKSGIPELGPYAAPEIRWTTLTSSAVYPVPYDSASFRRALIEGVDPSGRRLHYPMPVWDLGEEEISSLIQYLRKK